MVSGRRPKARLRDTLIKDDEGVPLFRIKHQQNSIALVLPIGKVSAKSLQMIQSAVAEILQQQPQTLQGGY